MAGAKEIRKRIVSVKNTKKITKTMEMVSTAKSKRMMDRIKATQPYALKVQEMIDSLSGARENIESPLLRRPEAHSRIALLVVTANRGLCGGYNSNVLKLMRAKIEENRKKGVEVDLYMIGKKGLGYCRFIKQPVVKSYDSIDDSLEYEQAESIAYDLMNAFVSRHVDRVEVISTVYLSSARQTADSTLLLPLGNETENAEKQETVNAIFEPNPEVILQKLLPFTVKMTVFRLLLEAITAEQIYRRIAMKSATDSAGEMQKMLTRTYNRVRQAAITQELSEIVAGADAIS